ncbi:hypothetical protein SFHH103_00424 [Sinorhizobium fredii HH103]|uniref:Uncharacterized protein n=1 Tax=Sinorhizobium fredii (strain HH103) TaxID=1117943 RepID=G9A123_SINF1|nr:hypothetical protein [Sinorhizobium fredii]CCE94924.1 hypothetical protein SFHH103_00424 [Sinorhizobium fredii HH103]
MRNFATIPPSIWQTDLKKLRGDVEAIAVHYHLTTNSHSTMIGIYPLPLMYLAYEVGIPLEGASKGLQRVCREGLATYDAETELVWVHEMAASQVAPRLSPKDNRVVSVAKLLAALPICPISLSFYERYRDVFHLRDQRILDEFERAFLGASDPLRSKDKEKEQDLGEGKGTFGSGVKEDTYTHARDHDPEHPYEQPPTVEEGKAFLMRLGLPPQFMEAALQRLMREALFPCDVNEWKREAREVPA